MTPDYNFENFAQFKQQLWMVVSSMERTLRRSHPRVSVAGSQFGEDKIFSNLLPEPNGYYIDIGAGSPIDCSNTWNLYQRGWRGLLIECLPSAWHGLLRQRPGDYLCPLAVSSEPGFARLRVADSVSSLQPDWPIEDTAEIIVECDTIMNVLQHYPTIRDKCEFMSIDVEGAEGAVLGNIDWDILHPKVIVVEAFKYKTNQDMSKEWNHLLKPRYKLHKENKLNQIYLRRD